jgi:hypothetical protein
MFPSRCGMCSQGLEFQPKENYRRSTARCFSAGIEIKRESSVGILVTEIRGNWRVFLDFKLSPCSECCTRLSEK